MNIIDILEEIYILLNEDNLENNEKIELLIQKSDELKILENNTLYQLIKNFIIDKFYINPIIPKNGHLYILFNEMFLYYGEHVYKLGECMDVNLRLKGYTTCYFTNAEIKYKSQKLRNCKLAENILFILLNQYRMSTKREFFNCPIDIIIEKILYIEELFNNDDKDLMREYKLLSLNYNKKLIDKLDCLNLFSEFKIINNEKLSCEIIKLVNKDKFTVKTFQKCLIKLSENKNTDINNLIFLNDFCIEKLKNSNKIECENKKINDEIILIAKKREELKNDIFINNKIKKE